MKSEDLKNNNKTYAIRFGLGSIKAVGFNMMQEAVKERELNGKFKDIYDFSQRLDPKSINKKSIEALAKSGSFDVFNSNRRQFSESFEILSSFASDAKEQANSNQMNLFGGVSAEDSRPALKNVVDWTKKQKLKFEFEAFGFFLNEHPIDDRISDLKRRGVVFSAKIEDETLQDNSIIKMAGIVASSKHRSGSRGRFAYLNISDPSGIYEATIFDEALITANRDLLEDGQEVLLSCLIKKDEGGTRIMIKEISRIEDFINNTKPSDTEFEDIKKLPTRKFDNKKDGARNNSSTPKTQNQNSFKNNFNAPQNTAPIPSNTSLTTNFNNNPEPRAGDNIANQKTAIKISRIDIRISDEKAILPLKTILAQKISIDGEVEIFLSVNNHGKIANIGLANKFKIQEIDLFRLKNLHKNLEIISVA